MNLSFGRMITTDNLEVVAHLVGNGSGIGILPSCVAESQMIKLKKEAPQKFEGAFALKKAASTDFISVR